MVQIKRRQYYGIVLCVLTAGILILIFTIGKKDNQNVYNESYVWNDELAPLMQFTYYTKEEWEDKIDTKGKLTNEDIKELLILLHLEEYIETEDNSRLISRKDWFVIYDEILDLLDEKGTVEKKTVLIMGENAIDNQDDTQSNTIVTSEGIYHTNIHRKWFADWYSYEVYCIGDELVGIAGRDKTAAEIKNAYIISCGSEGLTFLYNNKTYVKPLDTDEQFENVVANLQFENGRITKIRKKEERISGKLIAIDEDFLEIKGYGKVERDPAMKFYATYDGVQEVDEDSLLIENMNMTFLAADTQICAILLEEPPELRNIRVLLLNDGSLYRSDIFIVSDVPMKLLYNDTEQLLSAGEPVTASALGDKLASSSVTVTTQDGTGLLYLADAQGNHISQGYPGTLEIRADAKGYTLVNVVGLEAYVKGVLPSEMPSSYSEHALRAQAVGARSFAYIQLTKTQYNAYGAHVDDSVNDQVYNKGTQTEATISAVDATAGEVLTCRDEVVETYYFSTSCGHTGGCEVWNLNAEEYPYISGSWIRDGKPEVNLADENAFTEYIKNPDPACYESDVKFFRWNCVLDFAKKDDVLKQKIAERKEKQPDAIRYYTKDGGTETENLTNIGTLKDITVTARSDSGIVLKLALVFTNGTVLITSEYNIRAVLGSASPMYTWQDGTTGGPDILPSAYISIRRQEDGNYKVYGGGYGHGIGMSQNGAEKLALAGWNYADILKFFYKDVEITKLWYNMNT